LLAHIERGSVHGFICATSVTTVHYLAAKALDRVRARAGVERLLRILEVAPVNRAVLEAASESRFDDFEDGVIHAAGQGAGMDAIVTRNPADFRHAMLPVYSPAELVAILDQGIS